MEGGAEEYRLWRSRFLRGEERDMTWAQMVAPEAVRAEGEEACRHGLFESMRALHSR
jgi:hypothetical protein